MHCFEYLFINAKGKREKGLIKAHTLQQAKQQLCHDQIIFTTIKLLGSKKTFFYQKKTRVKRSDFLVALEQISQMLSAQIPIFEALVLLEQQYQGKALQIPLSQLKESIQQGESFSTALKKYELLDASSLCLIEAGEQTGHVEHSLSHVTTMLRKHASMKKEINAALIYPGILGAFAFCVILMMLCFVIPSLKELFEDREVSGFTKVLFWLSDGLIHSWPWVLGFSLSLGTALCFTWKKIKLQILQSFLNIPGLRSFFAKKACLGFTYTLAALLKGGVAIHDALKLAIHSVNHPVIQKELALLEKAVIEGKALSEEIQQIKAFPFFVSKMVKVGEQSGQLDLMLEKVASLLEEELNATVKKSLTLLQPMILLIMGALIGLIMISVILPLTDTSNLLQM